MGLKFGLTKEETQITENAAHQKTHTGIACGSVE